MIRDRGKSKKIDPEPILDDGWHVGHKRILACLERLCNVTTWRTVVHWKKKGFPLRYNHRGKPFVIEAEVQLFIIKHNMDTDSKYSSHKFK